MERETAYIIDEMHKLGISLTEQQSGAALRILQTACRMEQLYESDGNYRVLRGRAETFCGQSVDCEGKKYE